MGNQEDSIKMKVQLEQLMLDFERINVDMEKINLRLRELEKTVWKGSGIVIAIVTVVDVALKFLVK